MIITSEFFSFNVWEWFLHSSVLERAESDLSKINWLRGVILLNPIVLVPWGRFPLCHTPIRPISAFQDQSSILIMGCVTTWSLRFASLWTSIDTIQTMKKQSSLDSDVKCATIQFHDNRHNSQFDHWIKLKFYMESNMLSYLGLNHIVIVSKLIFWFFRVKSHNISIFNSFGHRLV
jgi:hypothetical protein